MATSQRPALAADGVAGGRFRRRRTTAIPGLGIAGSRACRAGGRGTRSSRPRSPTLTGDAVTFVALEDGTLVVDEDVPDGSLAPIADALEEMVSTAVPRGGGEGRGRRLDGGRRVGADRGASRPRGRRRSSSPSSTASARSRSTASRRPTRCRRSTRSRRSTSRSRCTPSASTATSSRSTCSRCRRP